MKFPVFRTITLVLLSCIATYSQETRSRRTDAHEQQKPPEVVDVIKVDANLVSVPVIVSDRQGRYIPDLKQQSFKLFDNGTEQTIAYFDAAEEPLSIALLLDTSRSTEGVLDEIKAAAMSFIKQLRPQDRAMIVSFDSGVHHLSQCPASNHTGVSAAQSGRSPALPNCKGGLTNDRELLEQAISSAMAGRVVGTKLNDAVMEVTSKDFKNITGRKAIILLSDGKDHGSTISAATLLDDQAESDTMVYSIFYASSLAFGGGGWGMRVPGVPGVIWGRRPRPGSRPEGSRRQSRRNENGAEFLRELSEVTSGRFYNSEAMNLNDTFLLIAEELRHQYRLGFYPGEITRDGTVHELRVKVDRPDVAVRARKQYRAVVR